MRKIKWIGIILIIVLALTACAKKDENSLNDMQTEVQYNNESDIEIKTITILDFEKEKDIQIIDIRDEDQYLGWKNDKGNSGHILNAMDFPSAWLTYEIPQEHIDIELERRGLDKSKKTVIYSNDDVPKEDYKRFHALGFTDLYALEGGFNQYVASGKKTERLEGYQKYVGPQWVQDLIDGKEPEGYDNDDYKIVEITLASEKELYEQGHIKGAININADELNHVPGPRNLVDYEAIPIEKQLTFWDLPTDEKIKEVLEGCGITKDTTVILYASEKATTAANRAALVMDYAGVKDIRFLNGGKVLWQLEDRPLVAGSEKLENRDFGATIPQNPGIIYKYEDELKFIEDPNAVIASVRSWNEYLGKESGYTYIGKAGDIKNSRFAYAGSNPYAMEDFRNLDNTMFNYKIIADRWERWGIVPSKTVSFHCGTGWRASETYYIAKALGWQDVGVYVGGWYEWTKKPNSPVAQKGIPEDAPEEIPKEYFYK
jgi:3-mercaptopyruvate sulfurtransferase SseA